jgi:hypothetical protein
VTFLFGDSTPTPYTTNILEALRDATDFLSAVAEADERIVNADERKREFRAAADAEAARLDALVRGMLSAISTAEKGEHASPTAMLGTDLAEIVSEKHHAANAAVTAKLEVDMRAVDAAVAAARNRYRTALETYLLLRVPPFADSTMRLTLVDGGKEKEDSYVAGVEGRWDFGLTWTLELGIAESSPWSKPLRVDEIIEDLSIRAPAQSGIIKKEVKLRKTKLGRHYVTRFVGDGTIVAADFRTEIGGDTGFDISINLNERVVTAARKGPAGDQAVGPFKVEKEDETALFTLLAKLNDLATQLPRKSLLTAHFDGANFDGNGEAQPRLVQLVTRLVSRLEPVVTEIGKRSKAEDELILRRSLADGHREEIFLPKSVLREKLALLDEAHRALFAPLGLAAPPRIGGGFSAHEPPTFPTVRSELPRSVAPAEAPVPEPEPEPEPAAEAAPEPAPEPVTATEDEHDVPIDAAALIAAVEVDHTVEPAAPPIFVPAPPPARALKPPTSNALKPPTRPALTLERVKTDPPPQPVIKEAAPQVDAAPRVDAAPAPEAAPAPPPAEAPAAEHDDDNPASIVVRTEKTGARNEALIATLKQIRQMNRDGLLEESYRQYSTLFTSDAFRECRADDQRQALKLMIMSKAPATVSDEMREAHRAAIGALQSLVIQHRDPADYEMLGMAYVVIDEPQKATEIWKKALDIERARNPASDLCGNLMRRVSSV